MTTMQWVRAAVQRIGRGSNRLAVLLARRTVTAARRVYAGVLRWLGESSGLAWWLRLGLLVAAALILRKLLGSLLSGLVRRIDTSPGFLWPLAIVWCIAAYRMGHPDWKPKAPPAATDEEVPAEPAETADPEVESAPLPAGVAGPRLPNIQDLREAVARVGTPHAHISVLAADLRTTPDRVREALGKWGVTVEPVRMRGGGSSTGVKGDHPALAIATNRVVAAGQPANNNSNTGADPEEGLREGLSIIRDPAHGHRWHVIPHSRDNPPTP